MTESGQIALDRSMMERALQLARKGWGTTHPNPMVGAVVAHGETILGEGFHAHAGEPHAEVNALQDASAAGHSLAEATLYITMEPCSTQGRTPPCTEAIRAAGVCRVVIGTTDPNPKHAGSGFAILRDIGCTVEVGVLEESCRDLNLIFNQWIVTGRPLWAAKIATTLDGKIATRTGESQWITGPEARRDVMRWRRYFPAIAVGSETALRDNPRLTARNPEEAEYCPMRFIFDRRLRLAAEAHRLHLFTDSWASRTILVTHRGHPGGALRNFHSCGVTVWEIDPEQWWDEIEARMGGAGIHGVYVEGGAGLLGSLLQGRRLHYLFCYQAPKILADHEAPAAFHGRAVPHLTDALQLRKFHHSTHGDDRLIRGFLHDPGKP